MNRRTFLATSIAAAGAAAQESYQIGCYTRPWADEDYRVALDGMAAAGYKYAGLMTTKGTSRLVITSQMTPEQAAAVGEDVRKRGMQTISVYSGGFPVEKSIEAGIAGLRRLIDNCAACGSPGLLLGGTGKEGLVEAYYKVVAECCDYAAGKNVGLSVKPHGGANATGAQCRKIIEKVGHRNFGVWYDPGNIFFYSAGAIDPVDDVGSVDGIVAGVSIKDFKPPKEVLVTPGTGKVNFREVFMRLKKGGFKRGPLVVECVDPGDTAQVTAEARKARQLLERLTAA
jgi:sugar phosphate isomerase/epimerase